MAATSKAILAAALLLTTLSAAAAPPPRKSTLGTVPKVDFPKAEKSAKPAKRRLLQPISFGAAGAWTQTTKQSSVRLTADPRARTTITIGGTNQETITVSTPEKPADVAGAPTVVERRTFQTTIDSQTRINLGTAPPEAAQEKNDREPPPLTVQLGRTVVNSRQRLDGERLEDGR